MTKDMTSGNIPNKLLTFLFPVFMASLLQQLYSMADSVIVGRFIGKEAFAAVGSTGSLNFLIIGFILGLCTGLTVPVAQKYGAGDLSGMRKKIVAAIYVAIALGISLSLITSWGSGSLLRIMKTPEIIYHDAHTYIFIIFLGIPATILYNLPANISRALGDSKTPLYFLIISALLNVILDLLFVIVFSMGVAGTAIATVISQIVSGTLCILFMKRKYKILRFEKEEWKYDFNSCKHSLEIGAPMGLQFSITAIGSVVLQSAVNTLGSDTVAAVNAAMKIQMVAIQPLDSLGITMATYAGQNLGAGKIKRIKDGVKVALIISVFGSLVAFIVSNFLSIPMTALFIKQEEMNPYIKSCIKKLLFINSCLYIPLGTLSVYRNTLQGLGHSVIAMGAGLFEMVGRSVVAFVAVGYFGFQAICFANPTAWIAANVILIPMYVIIMKKLSNSFPKEKINIEKEMGKKYVSSR